MHLAAWHCRSVGQLHVRRRDIAFGYSLFWQGKSFRHCHRAGVHDAVGLSGGGASVVVDAAGDRVDVVVAAVVVTAVVEITGVRVVVVA